MREAVIVSTARTPIGRAYRGAFNATPSPTLAGHCIDAAVTVSYTHLTLPTILLV